MLIIIKDIFLLVLFIEQGNSKNEITVFKTKNQYQTGFIKSISVGFFFRYSKLVQYTGFGMPVLETLFGSWSKIFWITLVMSSFIILRHFIMVYVTWFTFYFKYLSFARDQSLSVKFFRQFNFCSEILLRKISQFDRRHLKLSQNNNMNNALRNIPLFSIFLERCIWKCNFSFLV